MGLDRAFLAEARRKRERLPDRLAAGCGQGGKGEGKGEGGRAVQNRTEFLGDYGKQKPCAADPGQDAQGNAHGTQAEPLKADRASQLLLCGPYGGQQPKLLHALAEGDLKGVIDQEKRPHHDNGQQAAADRDQEGLKYRALRCPQKAQHGLIVQSLAAVPGVAA